MKAERADFMPKVNLLEPEGVRSQAHNEQITHVFLTAGFCFKIEPGSFHFYKAPGDRAVPFVLFDVSDDEENGPMSGHRMEMWPASVAGWAYIPSAEESK